MFDLAEENLRKAVSALEDLEYQPQVPVALCELANEESRQEWVVEKDAKVLTLFSDAVPGLTVDILLEVPFDFGDAYEKRRVDEPEPGVEASFLGLEDLLVMKEQAGRPQDLADVHKLRQLVKRPDAE